LKAKHFLDALIHNGAGQHLPVVFDFDNTIVCGDIGEATFAILVRDDLLNTNKIPETLRPDFRSENGELISLRTKPDLIHYYEALQNPITCNGGSLTQPPELDPAPFSTAYVWVAQIMAGLTPLEIVEATAKAFALSQSGRLVPIEITRDQPSYPAPFFYAESVELIAELLRHEFDVWIVSASNVWSVRWMVLNALNPLLMDSGVSQAIGPEKVVGISLLMQDSHARFYKDPLLVKENSDYATLKPNTLRSLKLTSALHHPIPTASGKVACIWEQIGRAPYLGVGDSPGDLPMLAFSKHRLWFARQDKPSYDQHLKAALARTGSTDWFIQKIPFH